MNENDWFDLILWAFTAIIFFCLFDILTGLI